MRAPVMVMWPQHFHIVAPQAAALGGSKSFRQRGHISAGKDVRADEWAGCAGRRHPADAMNEGIAVRRQQLADLCEILVEMLRTDMFHHANRDNAVELAGELPIVQF